MRPPKVAWDVSYLNELRNQLGDTPISLCVSPIAFRMLTDLSRIVLWHTRYTGIDYGDLPDFAWDVYHQLNNPNACGAGEVDDVTRDEILAAIAEGIEEMTINNTIYNGCGCGCGCAAGCAAGGADTTPIDSPAYPPGEIPTGGIPVGTNQDEAQKCSLANYMVYALRLSLLKSIEHTGNITEFNDWFMALWVGIKDSVESWLDEISYGLFSWLMAKLNGSTFTVGELAVIFDSNFNDYVCTLFSSTSETDAHQRLYVAINSTIPDGQAKEAALAMIGALPYSILFAEAGSIDVPPGFENRSCCGNDYSLSEPPPELVYTGEIGLRYEPMDFTSVEIEANEEDEFVSVNWSFDGISKVVDIVSPYSESSSFGTAGLDMVASVPLQAGEERHGFILEVVENTGDATGLLCFGELYENRVAGNVQGQCFGSVERPIVQSDFEGQGYVFVPDLTTTHTVNTSPTFSIYMQRIRPASGVDYIRLKLRV